MNKPVFALAAVAFAMVAIFIAIWLRDASRNKKQVNDGERLDVSNEDA